MKRLGKYIKHNTMIIVVWILALTFIGVGIGAGQPIIWGMGSLVLGVSIAGIIGEMIKYPDRWR